MIRFLAIQVKELSKVQPNVWCRSSKISVSSENHQPSKVGRRILALVLAGLCFLCNCVPAEESTPPSEPSEAVLELPEPRHDSGVSIEETLLKRRSVRDYTGEPLTLEEVSQLLWAAQGTTSPRGLRTAPSAGATYPLETYVIVGDVEGLTEGVYHYKSKEHKLVKVLDRDCRAELVDAALGLGTVVFGAFRDGQVREILKLPQNEQPLYIMPVGKR